MAQKKYFFYSLVADQKQESQGVKFAYITQHLVDKTSIIPKSCSPMILICQDSKAIKTT